MVSALENSCPLLIGKSIGTLLCENGFETRFAGGCVRDMIMGRTPKDYDLATTATPLEVKTLLELNGIKVIPTGIEHGTVTAIKKHHPFEITTLRNDVKCDGRRATVTFSLSFKEDARRRDFTINALFQDMHGRIYDYVNGQNDLKEKKLLFVGSPEKRIDEDALRILRYFRFLGRFDWIFNPQYHDTLISKGPGLTNLSRERIKAEIDHILLDSPDLILPTMHQLGLFKYLFMGIREDSLTSLWPKNLFAAFPTELEHLGFRWFILFNHLYHEDQDIEEMGRAARFTNREVFLMGHLKKIISSIQLGQSGIQPCLNLIKGRWISGEQILMFLHWYESRFFLKLPKLTEKVLESVDNVTVPSISKALKSVFPPQKRKQFSFIFRVSCYLKSYHQGEEINFLLLEKKLKERGFDSQREFNDKT